MNKENTLSAAECKEILEIKLYPVTQYKTKYILTVFYPKTVSFQDGKQMWELIKEILTSNNLLLNEVTIFLYTSIFNRFSEVQEWVFDEYLNRFVGDYIKTSPLADSSDMVKEIHFSMINQLNLRGEMK